MPTPELIALLLRTAPGATNIILSPMRSPEVERNGLLLTMDLPSVPFLVPDDTSRITNELIGGNAKLRSRLEDDGSCSFSWFLPGFGRFRVSIFSQRGSYVISLRVIPEEVPSFSSLGLPPQLAEIAGMRSGLVMVIGPGASGKSSTLAAILDQMNQQRPIRILTIEDPIEFLLPHIRSTIHQRELYRDFPSFRIAMKAALLQPPHVILLGTIPDRETMELALEAAEAGHLVLSSLHTPDAARTFDHILCLFPEARHAGIRARLASEVRMVISQRLLARKDGAGCVAIFEILRSTPRVRACLKEWHGIGPALEAAIREGKADGMQSFEEEVARLVKDGILDEASAEGDDALLLRRFSSEYPAKISAPQAALSKKPGQR
jgi:twitching motility protein PilT